MNNINRNSLSSKECLTDAQILLNEAFAKRNIQDFRHALQMGATPSVRDDNQLNIFEKALQTPGCVEFVNECILSGCNTNYVNINNNKAVIHYAIDSRDPKILKALLRNPGVDVDLEYSNLTPLTRLAKNVTHENFSDIFECMQILLEYGASIDTTDKQDKTPIDYIIKNWEIDATEKQQIVQLFLKQSDLNIEWACLRGNWRVLETLLENPDIELSQEPYTSSELILVITKLHEKPTNTYFDYWKCFYILLKCDKIDINKMDAEGDTALHTAVVFRNNKAIKELLKRGADICIRNFQNVLAIENMSPQILEKHLNNCITHDDADFDDKNYKICISFKNFITEKKSCQKLTNVMAPISFIAKSEKHQYLLKHPVITSFLFLKWHKVSFLFYINLIIYLFYAVSIIIHSLIKFRVSGYKTTDAIAARLSWSGTIFLIIREMLQFLVHPKRYLRSFTNYVELVLIALSVITCMEIEAFDYETQRIIAVFLILFIAVELCFLVGYLPISSISTHMLMLKAVCKSFWKSFFLYSILIVSFTLSFYIMHDKPEKNYEAFDNFPNPLVAFTKTIVMLTGEFDAASLKLKSNYSYIIFLLFVCFITIILFNLINGLAVSETQAIQDQGELNYIICRTHLLAHYQQLVNERSENSKTLVNFTPFRDILKYFQYLFPDRISQIAFLPNDNNKIVIPKTQTNRNRKEPDYEYDSQNDTIVPLNETDVSDDIRIETTILPCCFSFITGKCAKMDERTVTMVIDILDRKFLETVGIRSETTEEILQKMERNLKNMMKKHFKNFKKKFKP